MISGPDVSWIIKKWDGICVNGISRHYPVDRNLQEKLASGVSLLRVKVTVVAVGIRKERDKHDVYRVAKKLMELGLLKLQDSEEEAE